MPNASPIDRGFAEAVRRHFGFLHGLGFNVVSQRGDAARYFSANVSLEIFQDRRVGEISMELRNANVGASFLTAEGLSDWSGVDLIPLNAGSRQYTDYAVSWLAQLLKEHCEAILRGDDAAWREALDRARSAGRRYTIGIALSQMRSVVPDLWKSRSYSALVDLMAPLEAHLRPSELRKLEIARRRSAR